MRYVTHSSSFFRLRGILAICFGMVALLMPVIIVHSIAVVLGAFAVVDSVTTLMAASHLRREGGSYHTLIVRALAGLIVGVFVLLAPGPTIAGAIYLLASLLILTGLIEFLVGMMAWELLGGWLIASAIVSVSIAVFILCFPRLGVVAVGSIVGIYTILVGCGMLVLSVRLSTFNQQNRSTLSTKEEGNHDSITDV